MSGHDLATIRRTRNIARLAGAVIGMVVGVIYGTLLVAHSSPLVTANRPLGLAAVLAAGAAASSALALAMPLLTVDPYTWLRDVLDRAPPAEIAGAVAGLITALVVSALVAVLLAGIPWGLGVVVSLCLACALINVGVGVGRRRGEAFARLATGRDGASGATAGPLRSGAGPDTVSPARVDGTGAIALDTSALIDGRLPGIVSAGFLRGTLLIPRFVLDELQQVADSASPVRRAKGRRGLEEVRILGESQGITCEVVEAAGGTGDVDSRLIGYARERGAALLTTDFNLDRVARLAGVRVLNLNTLASALKPAVIAGDIVAVAILKEGREAGQGVGYLDDGTMVVVQGGRGHVGQTLSATVSSVLQTSSGRIVFAAAQPGGANPSAAAPRARMPQAATS